ncbi:MAG TPA: 3-dehydroquinate synthase [Desulfobacteraceae bacterium]|nr:3-dehydroquinate synthase [Desulfobacteraceae bacterium]
MKTLQVKTENRVSSIHVGEKLGNVSASLPGGKTIIITDENVERIYGPLFPRCPVITIPTGEKIKTLATCETIYRELIRLKADRSTFILGIGGGIVCDITGFAASTYMRGLPFGFVATTLLSQVDASVGGKNGVNFDAFKNMVGVFSQPEFVLCDTAMLNTLPEKEIVNGLAEIVKHGLIADEAMVSFLEANAEKALALDHDVITRLVLDSVRIKGEIVEKDERETGDRRKLNFGHTIGHALEKTATGKGISHGMAVAVGMAGAADLSRKRGLITEQENQRITRLLHRLHLPTTHDIPPDLVMDAVAKDKKKQDNTIHFVFLAAIGLARVEKADIEEIRQAVFT